jgi:NAD(P)-dependent dehydrogenase (short-subunit alcohol dehydrogenase family)
MDENFWDLNGKVAIITGGARGLGYDMACALASAGCNLILTSRFKNSLEEPVQHLKTKYNVEVMGLELDHRHFNQVSDMAEKAMAFKGSIDILINNAGGGSGSGESDFFLRSPEEMADMLSNNLLGAMYCCREIGKIMSKQNSGKIINIASIAGMVGRDRSMYRKNQKTEQTIDYAAAKAGIIGMTRDLAAYLAPYHICVNSISPGGFYSKNLPDGFVADYNKATALGRMGEYGRDIKGTILFLSSHASDYITGQNLVVDGGFTIWK